ncbi:MAG: glycosyltransferase family 4 protein [Ardenticatenaceae bacterium]|nr:glycosyltransferase family 4 protein [Ardenticatenaceae bacterium]
MTKTILFINANNSEVGGADISLLKMAVAVKESGFDPIVVLRTPNPLTQQFQIAGVELILLPLLRIRASASLLRKSGYIFRLMHTVYILLMLIRRVKPDLVHTNDYIDGAGNLAAWIAQIPSVQHVRLIGEKPIWLLYTLRFLSSFSDVLICVSEAVRIKMVMWNQVSTVLYDWADMVSAGQSKGNRSLFEELSLSPQTRLIACIGRLEHWKGQHLFLKAANNIADRYPNVHFLIVGGTTTNKESYLEELEAIHETLENKNRITFLGYREDIANILRQIEIMVHTSIRPEPFGLVVMEALSQKALVVAADAGGIGEQIEHGVTGFLYGLGNQHGLESALEEALNTAAGADIKANGVKFVNEHFNKQVQVSKLIQIYENRWNTSSQ